MIQNTIYRMNTAIKSMNNCVQGYLHLTKDVIGNIHYYDDYADGDTEGNAEEYIKNLEFKEKELDLDEEWDKFCNEFFNDYRNTGNNFYREVDNCMDLSQEFNSTEMIYLLKETNNYFIELTEEPFNLFEKDEEDIWNCIAYCWIRNKSNDIEKFIKSKIQDKFNELSNEKINFNICNPVCVPRGMNGTSDWKCCGYNSPCGCYKYYKSLGERP